LCVGTLEPRKNLSGVLDAFCQLDPELQRQYPLAIAGPPGWKSTQLESRIDKLENLAVVKRLGYVANDHLPALYSAARVFIYPSFYEGFGLPLLEAMQCGCPCITSDKEALAEVAGDAAVLVNPHHIDEISEELIKLLESPEKSARYSQLAKQRAGYFSWQKTVQQTWHVYASI
jgi:alpha-1,3-rhamnosyl/mannosyltransferase